VRAQGVPPGAPAAAPSSGLPGTKPKAEKNPPAVLHVPDAVKRRRSPSRAVDESPPTVFSVMPPEVMAALGKLEPTPGAWVEYGVRKGASEESRMRLSVLSPLLPAGRYWLELVVVSEASLPLVLRLLLKGDPSDPANVERMLVIVAGQAPLELPVDQATEAIDALGRDAEGRKYQPEDRRPGMGNAKVERLARESVTVPGGSFACDKLRITDQRTGEVTLVWKSAEVPLLPLVRAQGKKLSVELLGAGKTGAHSLIADEKNEQGQKEEQKDPPEKTAPRP
jgi:hypothetical protein